MISSADEFVTLRSSSTKSDYDRAAHDTATDEVWLNVIEQFPEMRKWVAHNKTVPLFVLAVLSKDSDPTVRLMVAMKRKCPGEILMRFAKDSDESVRNAVAMNPGTTIDALKILALDEWAENAEIARQRLKSLKV
jgi:hypothetical protein